MSLEFPNKLYRPLRIGASAWADLNHAQRTILINQEMDDRKSDPDCDALFADYVCARNDLQFYKDRCIQLQAHNERLRLKFNNAKKVLADLWACYRKHFPKTDDQ